MGNQRARTILGIRLFGRDAAHAPLSVVRADLHLHVFDAEGEASEVILQSTRKRTPPIWDLKMLNIPLDLETRASASGWLSYRIPERVSQALTIDRYELVFVSSSGDRASLEQDRVVLAQLAAYGH